MSSAWPVASALLVGRYRLVTLLETGGMAEIWRADDQLLDRPVAVKLPTGPQFVWREARMAARLSHPGIAAVHDYREAVRPDGAVIPFVVMELLEGESVAARVDREPFGWAETARVGAAVADALAAAHASGVVHRDIKPGNVMLTPNGVKILDFGISVAAGEPDDDDTGATFGTPAYVAPERLDGEPAEPATDVYGLGVLLFEMVTGDPPYPVDTWEELAAARTAGPAELPPSLPDDFREVVARCLNDDPRLRPTAARLRADLLAVALRSRPDPVAAVDSSRPTAGVLSTDRSEGAVDRPGAGRRRAPQPTLMPVPAAMSRPDAGSRAAASSRTAPKPRVTAMPWPDLEPAPAASTDPAPAAPRSRSTPGSKARTGEERAPGISRRRPATRGFATGRAPAATVAMTGPPRRRAFAVGLSTAALAAAVGAAVAVLTLTGGDSAGNRAATPPATAATSRASTPTASPPASAAAVAAPPTRTPPSRSPSASARSTPSSAPPTARITLAGAVSQLRVAIQDGSNASEIRIDVATDLLNLVQNLSNANGRDVTAQTAQLRVKIQQRVSEGTITPARATILDARLADIDNAGS